MASIQNPKFSRPLWYAMEGLSHPRAAAELCQWCPHLVYVHVIELHIAVKIPKSSHRSCGEPLTTIQILWGIPNHHTAWSCEDQSLTTMQILWGILNHQTDPVGNPKPLCRSCRDRVPNHHKDPWESWFLTTIKILWIFISLLKVWKAFPSSNSIFWSRMSSLSSQLVKHWIHDKGHTLYVFTDPADNNSWKATTTYIAI